MSLSILRQGVEVEQLIGEDRSQLLVKVDAPVQGAGREPVDVLLEDARILIESAEVQNDRVVVGGQAVCQALYRVGEDARLAPVSAVTPFEHIVDIPGAGARMTARVEGDVEHVEGQYEAGRMTFYVTLAMRVRVTNLVSIEPIAAIEGVAGLEPSMIELTSSKLNAEASAPALLRDEVSLPAALQASGALLYWPTPKITHVARDLGGARVSGEVAVEALIKSDVAGRPVALVRDTLSFDELVEFPDWLGGELEAVAAVRALNVETEADDPQRDGLMRVHCELDIHVRVSGEDTATVLSDAYATGAEGISVTREAVSVCGGIQRAEAQELYKATVFLPEGAPGVGTVLAVRVWPSVSEWTHQNGVTTVSGVLESTVLYMPGGSDRLSSVRSEQPFETHLSGALDSDAWISVSAAEAEASALMSDRLEMRCMLKTTGAARVAHRPTVAMDAVSAAAPVRRKGIVISYPADDETLWDVGKRYALPMDALQAAAGGAEYTPGKPLIFRL